MLGQVAAGDAADALDPDRRTARVPNGRSRDASIERSRFSADTSPTPSSSSSCSFVEPVVVGDGAHEPGVLQRRAPASRPGRRCRAPPAKCLSSCQRRSGQSRLGQRVNTRPASLTVGVPHDGQRAGGRSGGERSGRSTACGAGETTCGITSPARSTITSSPDADVLAREVLLVVQRRELDRDAADVDRLEHGERVQVAELADVPLHLVEPRDGGRGRELPRDRPARVAADGAEAPLQLEVVDLHHDAVDLEVERAAPLLPARGTARRPRPRSCSRWTSPLTRKPCARSHSSASQWLAKRSPSVAPIP